MGCTHMHSGTTALFGFRPPLTRSGTALSPPYQPYIGAQRPCVIHRRWPSPPAAQLQDRDHAAAASGDPHQTPLPRPPPACLGSAGRLRSADLEFGSDALSGTTLETPKQLQHPHPERLHQQDLAREAFQAQAAHEALAADESTAAEREERYQGILQAMDALGAGPAAELRGGASDPDTEGPLSPDAARLASPEGGEDALWQEALRFEELRRTADALGEGDEAAELIRESYRGRDLEAEALGTVDPADHMPHPGDRYLPPHALASHAPPSGAMAARLNHTHSRPNSDDRRVLPLPLTRSSASGAWLPPQSDPAEAPRAGQGPIGAQPAALGPCEAGNDDTVDYAMRGADAMYYADDYAANPAVNSVPGGESSGVNVDGLDAYDMEADALRGADAMFYFSGAAAQQAQQALEGGLVWGALHSPLEKHSVLGRAMIEAAALAAAGPAFEELRPVTVLASVRRQQAEREDAERSMSQLAGRLKGGRGPPEPPPKAGLGRLLEVAGGRAAAAGLAAAFLSELVTQQSVLSQLLGRWEGPRLIEQALPASRTLATAVLSAVVAFTLLERMSGSGGTSPRWRPLGLSPPAQLWLGRAAMAGFAALLAYETMHSNRPAFATFFYLWF